MQTAYCIAASVTTACAVKHILSVQFLSVPPAKQSPYVEHLYYKTTSLQRPAPHLFHTSPFGSITQLVTGGLNSRRRWAGEERGGGEEVHNDTLRCTQTEGTLHKDCQLAKPRHFSMRTHVRTCVRTFLHQKES